MMVILGMLLLSSIMSGYYTHIESNIIVHKETIYRPVFEGLSAGSNGTIIVERDTANHQGAIIKANIGDNITILYSYKGGTNTTLPKIFGDDGNSGNNLSWTEPLTMIYDKERTELEGGTTAYYNYTLHVNSDFIVFIVRLGNYEDPFMIPNIITTGVRIESAFLEDFYTQFDQISMNVTMYNYNISTFGLMYRKVTPEYDEPFKNVTVALTEEGTVGVHNISFANQFAPGAELEVRAFIQQFDNQTKEYRYLHENKAHIITIIDGRPTINLNAKEFTNKLNVSISWNATAPKANITAIEIDWGDESVLEQINNVSITQASHVYSAAGKYNITLIAHAGAAIANKTVSILIDQTAPTGNIMVKNNETIVTNGMKEVTFVVTASDNEDGSGLEKIVLSTDEGNIYEYKPEKNEITLTFLDFGAHTVNLTVYDKAGNTYTTSTTFILDAPEIPKDSPVPFPFGLITIVSLVTIAIILRKARK